MSLFGDVTEKAPAALTLAQGKDLAEHHFGASRSVGLEAAEAVFAHIRKNSGHDVDLAFSAVTEKGAGGRLCEDFRLTRFGAYLTVEVLETDISTTNRTLNPLRLVVSEAGLCLLILRSHLDRYAV